MATLKDISRATGLSVSVVSRALNPRPDPHARVSTATRRRIRSAARRLGFHRDRSAEFLRRGRRASIGVFLPTIANRLVADLVFGLAEGAERSGFPLTFSFGMTLASYRRFIEGQVERGHCGIVSYPYFTDSRVERLIRSFLARDGRMVLLNTDVAVPGVPVVAMDDVAGGRLAASHLLKRGCRSFVVVGRYPGRQEGFCQALAERGASAVAIADAGLTRARLLAAAGESPVGVFAVTDFLAMRVMGLLRDGSPRVGEDVLLVGYDDLDAAAELTPPLTTVRQHFREEGLLAMNKLIRVVDGTAEESATVAPTLVVRDSA